MREDNVESIYPLTPVQLGMLFHSSYDQKSGVYVETLSFSIHGALDVLAFKEAWQEVVKRHSTLRTLFVWENRETPLQIVRSQVDLPWQEKDWSHLSEVEQHEQLQQLLKNGKDQRFNLSEAPLLRFSLVRHTPDRYHFIWSYHHMILDGWSVARVLDEVFSIYRSIVDQTAISLDEPIPYKAYVNWLQQQDMVEAEKYWNAGLKGFVEPTPLNFGDPPKKDIDPNKESFESQTIYLSKDVTDALGALARENRLTMSTLLQGAWAYLLSQYSGEEDVLFGAAVAGRSIGLQGIETMVGLFIGSLPVRVRLSPQTPLITWLQEIQTQLVKDRQYEYSSLREIQSWSEINRSQGQALFDSIVSFNNYDLARTLREKSVGLEIQDISSIEGSHFPLTMLITPGVKLRIRINYDYQRFDRAVIERILEQLRSLLEDMVTDPFRPLSTYSLLSASEKQAWLDEFNRTEVSISTEKNVIQLFEEQARLTPEAIALRFEGQTLTYAQLNERANQLAHHLVRKGIVPEKVVALCLDRSLQAIIAILGTLKAGGCYMPIDATLPAKRIALMLAETQAPIILTMQPYTDRLPTSNAEVICLDADWSAIESAPVRNPVQAVGLEQLAYIIYTSGSTGTPKGAMISHGNLLNYVSWAKDFYLKGEKLDFPLFSSLSFDLTVTSVFVPLVSGSAIVIYGESDASSLAVIDIIQENLVDIIKLTPAHLALIKEFKPEGLRLRKMIVGGEDFKRGLAAQVSDLFGGEIEIYNEYGPTEATVGCMIHRFNPTVDLVVSVPIGRPINNIQIYILDQHLNPVAAGVIGEICIGGASVARGYLQRPELNASKFVDNPFRPGSRLYRTGDLARWTEDGQMQFLGRADHQVKIKGYRIELGEIASNLLDYPDIEAAVVTVVTPQANASNGAVKKCILCGLPDNFPGASIDAVGICDTCREFNTLKERFKPYWKTHADLELLVEQAQRDKIGKYDSMVLYSGGKDSSYMLYQLVKEYGMNPLVFSLDNGYISEEAKENIRRVTDALGVDLVFGQTPHMNAVFVDSLKRHSNVCDGCFKVIYTLSINLAHQKEIKYIFTGLTRGQLFETRLSDMFRARIFDVETIDQNVLSARKAYHRFDDAVTQLMDVAIFEDDKIFNEVRLVDFYRYTDVPLQEMYTYLDQNAPWTRPSDTGRSTNCLINDAGIYIHQKERGFHNYALPYSWDVRVGHKTRADALDDLNDELDEQRVHQMLAEIGYDESESSQTRLVAYTVARAPTTTAALREHLEKSLPNYMIPTYFMQLDQMPLTRNGKIDLQALPRPEFDRLKVDTEFVAPSTPLEIQLAEIWADVLDIREVGIHDNFFELGGDSISTIQVTVQVAQVYQIDLLPVELFNSPTIAELTKRIEDILLSEIDQLSDEEAENLLSSLGSEQSK